MGMEKREWRYRKQGQKTMQDKTDRKCEKMKKIWGRKGVIANSEIFEKDLVLRPVQLVKKQRRELADKNTL